MTEQEFKQGSPGAEDGKRHFTRTGPHTMTEVKPGRTAPVILYVSPTYIVGLGQRCIPRDMLLMALGETLPNTGAYVTVVQVTGHLVRSAKGLLYATHVEILEAN